MGEIKLKHGIRFLKEMSKAKICLKSESTQRWGKDHCTAGLQLYNYGLNCSSTNK